MYTGRVCHADTQYITTLGQGKKSNRHRKEWFAGKHQAIISDELFEECAKIRLKMARRHDKEQTMHTYLLHGLVYCARCVATKPSELIDDRYGKMRSGSSERQAGGCYRCVAHDRGYHKCAQSATPTQTIDRQVVAALSQLAIPIEVRGRVAQAIRNRIENEASLERMKEIQTIVERIDFRWEQGFLTADEYITKCSQLQREIEILHPVEYDAPVDLIGRFNHYWAACDNVENPAIAQQQLIAQIVDRVYVYDNTVIGIVLPGDVGIMLDANHITPAEIIRSIMPV